MKTKQIVLAVLAFILAAAIMPFAASAMPYDKPGSVLLFPIFSSDPSDPSVENTMISLTDTTPALNGPVYPRNYSDVRCTFVYNDSSTCKEISWVIPLYEAQTYSFYMSDYLAGKKGFAVCAYVSDDGQSLLAKDRLLGQASFKIADGTGGLYGPLTYYANFAGSIPYDGKLHLGTDYTPGVPLELYVSGVASIDDSNSLGFYAGSSIDPNSIYPATDMLRGNSKGVVNNLTMNVTDDTLGRVEENIFGGCWDEYLSRTPPPANISSGKHGWLSIVRNTAAALNSTFGRLPGGIFAIYNPTPAASSFTSSHMSQRSINETAADLPMAIGAPEFSEISPRSTMATDVPASVLYAPFYYSSFVDPSSENTQIAITNVGDDYSLSRIFFIRDSGTVSVYWLWIYPKQTYRFWLSDFDPGVKGSILVVASNSDNYYAEDYNALIGTITFERATGQSGSYNMLGFRKLSTGTDTDGILSFDDVEYEQWGKSVIVPEFPSSLDGNTQKLVLSSPPPNLVTGSVTGSSCNIGTLSGVLYNETLIPKVFSFTAGNCMYDSFPTAMSTSVPSGESGWAKLYDTGKPLAGLYMNYNPASDQYTFNGVQVLPTCKDSSCMVSFNITYMNFLSSSQKQTIGPFINGDQFGPANMTHTK